MYIYAFRRRFGYNHTNGSSLYSFDIIRHKEVGQELENRSTHLGFSMWSRSCLNVQYVQNMPFCHRNCTTELLLDSNLCDFRLWPGTCDIHSLQCTEIWMES